MGDSQAIVRLWTQRQLLLFNGKLKQNPNNVEIKKKLIAFAVSDWHIHLYAWKEGESEMEIAKSDLERTSGWTYWPSKTSRQIK